MYLIKIIKGDITKVTDVQDNPDCFDLVEWVLFDTHTESVYESEVDKIYKKKKEKGSFYVR